MTLYTCIKEIWFYFAIKSIIQGKTVRLSVAQLTYAMIDLTKARRNLEGEEYLLIDLRYLKMQRNRKKQKVDFDMLYRMNYGIINYFCDVCCYEQICTEGPTAQLLERIRKG